MQKSKRFALFKHEVRALAAKIPGGSKPYRRYLFREAEKLADDLAKANQLPLGFSRLSVENITQYVAYLRECHYAEKTIRNKLSLLRNLNKVAEIKIIIPDNAALNIKAQCFHQALPAIGCMIDPAEIITSPIQQICTLQFLFGLKKMEAIRFDHTMIQPNLIQLPRSMTYNKKDRRIPIVSERQRMGLANFKPQQNADIKAVHGLSLLHRSALDHLNIAHDDYFRHCYILNRYRDLSVTHSTRDTFKNLRAETGYHCNAPIQDILSCHAKS